MCLFTVSPVESSKERDEGGGFWQSIARTMTSEESNPTTSNSLIDEEETIIDTLTQCVFCHNVATFKVNDLEFSRQLPCRHAICSNCVESWSETELYKLCPNCQVRVERKCKRVQRFNIRTVKCDKTMQTCDIHRGQSLNYWCLGCKQLICDVCIAAHKEMQFTRNHTMKDKFRIAFCTKHTQEYISHFCISCNVFTCRDCQLRDHRGHAYEPVHEKFKNVNIFHKNIFNN